MRCLLASLLLGALGAITLSAQPEFTAAKKEPPKDPVKGPMFPPINPAVAKLEFTITGLDGPGFGIAYGETSGTIVAGCERGTLQAFKKETVAAFKTGAGKPEIWKGHDGPVRAIAWTGGPTLASIGVDKKVNFWKMPEGKVAQTAAIDFRVRAAAMSLDGKSLAVAGEADSIQIFDVAAGKASSKLTDKMDWSLCVAFSVDGKQLLSGDYLGVVRLWDVGGKKVKDLPAPPTPAPKVPPDPVPVSAVAFAPDLKTAVIATSDGPIHLVNLGDGKIIRTYAGHTAAVTGIAFHPTGTLMATCSKDRTVKL
ncbi:MAG: hypothetical protein HY289_09605, partial [Planctomycetes bacterium]|nr:hypothetical protein [Planctomycetota bacterium]